MRYDETHAVSLLSLAKLLRDKGDLEARFQSMRACLGSVVY